MLNKTFYIPQPVIMNPICEYFSIQYRKINPIVSAWQTIPNVTTNSFILPLDYNSVYEIQASHHCCDGNDSDPITTTFNTATNNPMIYACMIETTVSDTCATTPGNCRNCQVRKSYKVRFYSNPNATNQINIPNSIQLRIQETVNGVVQPYYTVGASAGNNEVQLWTKVTYEETCIGGNSQTNTLSVALLDGQFEQYPYTVISCVSNNPTLTEISNTSTGAGGIRTQVFKVGNDILPGNKFQLGVYSVVKTVLAVTGDTPTSIAQKLRNAINNTTASQWNAMGSAPTNQNGFPPNATSSGSNVTITLNHQNNFGGYAYEN